MLSFLMICDSVSTNRRKPGLVRSKNWSKGPEICMKRLHLHQLYTSLLLLSNWGCQYYVLLFPHVSKECLFFCPCLETWQEKDFGRKGKGDIQNYCPLFCRIWKHMKNVLSSFHFLYCFRKMILPSLFFRHYQLLHHLRQLLLPPLLFYSLLFILFNLFLK